MVPRLFHPDLNSTKLLRDKICKGKNQALVLNLPLESMGNIFT